MTTLLIFIAAGFVLAVASLIIGYRLTKPHSKKLGQQQAHINSRAGGHQPAPAPAAAAPAAAPVRTAAAAPAAPATAPAPKPPVKDASWVWTAMLVVLTGAVLYFWVYQDPVWGNALSGASALNTWAWSHWLGILVLAGLLWAIVELNSTDLGGAAHVLRRMLLWGVLALFIGTWLLGFFDGRPSQPSQHRSKVDVLEMSANGKSAHVSAPPGYAASFTGSGFTTHCVYTDGREGIVGDAERPCVDGPMLYQYVKDTTGRANAVTYKFVRP